MENNKIVLRNINPFQEIKGGFHISDNDIEEVLLEKLRPVTFCIYRLLYRLSFGYHKNWTIISRDTIKNKINASLNTIRSALNELIKLNLVVKQNVGRFGTTYIVFRPSETNLVKRSNNEKQKNSEVDNQMILIPDISNFSKNDKAANPGGDKNLNPIPSKFGTPEGQNLNLSGANSEPVINNNIINKSYKHTQGEKQHDEKVCECVRYFYKKIGKDPGKEVLDKDYYVAKKYLNICGEDKLKDIIDYAVIQWHDIKRMSGLQYYLSPDMDDGEKNQKPERSSERDNCAVMPANNKADGNCADELNPDNDLWDSSQENIMEAFGDESYQIWLKDLKSLGIGGNILYLRADTKFVRDYVSWNYQGYLEEILGIGIKIVYEEE